MGIDEKIINAKKTDWLTKDLSEEEIKNLVEIAQEYVEYEHRLKADYETRLKADMIAMLEEIESMFWELTKNKYDMQILYEKADDFEIDFNSFIQRKIDKLKENSDVC